MAQPDGKFIRREFLRYLRNLIYVGQFSGQLIEQSEGLTRCFLYRPQSDGPGLLFERA